MKILVTGASGLIGTAVVARLTTAGHQVVRAVRVVPEAPGNFVKIDMATALTPEDWRGALAGVDAVVNCAGVLQDSGHEQTRQVHALGPAALFDACERAGIRRIIHFSAIGVERAQPSSFSATKFAGDRMLMERDLDWIILRPSVVLGRPAFGASAMFRGLAALPLLPLMPDTGRLQVVQLDELVETVVFFLEAGSPSRLELDLAGPEPLSFQDIVVHYRGWLGWRPAPAFTLPRWVSRLIYRLGDLAGALGWRPPVRTNAAREIARGAIGNPDPWHRLTGIQPRSLQAALTAHPATVQERWFAGLYFIKPAIFVVLPFFWIMTGVISLTTGWHNGVGLLLGTAVSDLAGPAVVAGAIADIIIGTLIAFRRRARLGLQGAIAICLFYAVAGTILRPDLWNQPLGPLMKILPIFLLHLVALAILEER